MERDTIITSDEEITIAESEKDEVVNLMPQSFVPEGMEDEEEELPEIEVDAWIDIEDQWEKDYFFVVFTDIELYQYLYALYYPLLKDEKATQRVVMIQQKNLKNVLASLQRKQDKVIPMNVIPVFHGMRRDMETSLGAYLKTYKTLASSKPYKTAGAILDRMYHDTFEKTETEPYLTALNRMEFQIITQVSKEEESTEKSKKQKRGKIVKKKTQKEAKTKEPSSVDDETITRFDTYIVQEKDELPVPIKGILKKPHLDEKHIPSLYLHERVAWKDIPIDSTLEYKDYIENTDTPVVQKQLQRTLYKDTQYDFKEVLTSIKTVPSLHTLDTTLQTYGYTVDMLSEEQRDSLNNHIRTLFVKESRSHKVSSQRFSWSYKPQSNIYPSEQWMWSSIKSWMEESLKDIDKVKEELYKQLELLEKQTDTFVKNSSIPMDIDKIALQLQSNQLDIEDVIETLRSMYRESQQIEYTHFLKELVEGTWSVDLIEEKKSDTGRLDVSIQPEKRPILTTYDYHMDVLKGRRSFMTEDVIGSGEDIQETGLEEDTGDIIKVEDDIEADDVAPLIPFEEETSVTLVEHIPTQASNGQREVMLYVVKLLMRLQSSTELPLHMDRCIEQLLKIIDRKSQYEQLCEKLPEISPEELKNVFEQKTMYLAISDVSLEDKFKQVYREVIKEHRRAVVDTFFYALTWWVIHLQEAYIQNPKSLQPGMLPCMPVWAFYGTPMSSSDEKGIARYIICTLDYLRKQEEGLSSEWGLFEAYTEQHMLDKIYKMSKHDDFVTQVTNLKQEWKDRWKEVARKEKEMDIRLDTLEKTSHHTPQEYLSIYVELMKRLPTLLYQKNFDKRSSIVVPVANSCCLQSLNAQFEPYSDIKGTALYEKRSLFFKKTAQMEKRVQRLARVVISEKQSSTDIESLNTCMDDTAVSYKTLIDIDKKSIKHEIYVSEWNQVCNYIGQSDWKLPILKDKDTSNDEDIPIKTLTTSHIQRALRDIAFLVEKHVSNQKKQFDTWKQFIQTETWHSKLKILQRCMLCYQQEKTQYRKLEWVESIMTRCIERVRQIKVALESWKGGHEDIEEGVMNMLNYILYLALIMPSIPSDDYKQFYTKWQEYDIETIDQKWLREIIDRRLTILSDAIRIQHPLSNDQIQEYYANMREKLKETNLAEYKSKSIEEIQEIQEAKRLKLKKVADAMAEKSSGGGGISIEEGNLRPSQSDFEVEQEGEFEYRKPAENPDDTHENALD